MTDKNTIQNNLKLQQTVRFFETLLRASADGIVITDPAKNIIFVNDTFCQFFSSNRHDVIETNLFFWLEKLDPRARDVWKGLESQINEHGIAKDVEFSMKTGEGMRYFSVNSSHLEKIDIEETGLIISIWRDDTERKMAHEALLQAHDELEMRVKERTAQLQENEEKYRRLFENSNDIIVHVDRFGKVLTINNKLEEVLGFKPHEFIGKYFFNIGVLGLKDLPMILGMFKNAVQKGTTQDRSGKFLDKIELALRAKNGKLIPVETSTTFLKKDGKIDGFLTNVRDITKRKQSDEALRESEERYRTIVEHSNDMIWTLDTEGKFLFFNKRSEEVSGYKLEDWQGRSFAPLIVKDDLPKVIEAFKKTIEGQPQQYEVSFTAQNGSIVTLDGNTAPIYSKGKVIGTVTLGRDITEQKKVQDALKESENRFRGIFEQSPVAIEIYDSTGKLIEANRECLDLFGIDDIDEVKDFNLFDDPNLPLDARRRLTNFEPVKFESIFDFDIVKKAGLYRTKRSGQCYIDVVIMPLQKDENAPFGYLVHIREITDRKKAEIEREQFFKFFRISSDLMVIADPNGCFKKVNPACLQTLGYSEAELLAKPFVDFVHPDDLRSTIDEMASQIKLGYSNNFENRYICRDGTIRWLSWRANYDKDDRITYATARDITEHKRAEEMLLKSETDLKEAQRIGNIGSWIYDFKEKLSWSAETYRIYGVSPDTFILDAENFMELIHPQDRPKMKAWIEACMAGKNPDELEFRIILPDGTVRYISGRGELEYDARNRPTYMAGTAQDITERKLADDMLKLHEIRLNDMLKLHRLAGTKDKYLIEFTLDACLRAVQSDFAFIGLMNADETVMFNQAWSKKVMTECEISEKTIEYTIAQAGLWGEVVRQRRHIIVNDYNTSKEFKKGYPQGHVPIKRLLGIPIFSGSRIVAVACAANKTCDYTESDASAFISLIHEMWDILEHRRKEEEVSKNRAMLLKAQEIGHVGSWEWDIITNDVIWTKEIYTIYGLDPDKVKPDYELVLDTMSPESKAGFLKAIDDTLKSRKPFDMEYSLIRPDGQKSYVHTRGEVLFDSRDRPLKMFGMVQDITQRKIAQDERVSLIEKEHEARTEAEAARKLDRMKSMFIAATSHELRTPLNSIIGFTGLVLDGTSGELNPDQKMQLELVHSSGKHLLSLINDIIDLSMIESGRRKVVISEFNLRQIVDEAATNLNVSLNEKKLVLKVDVENIKMKSDRMRMLQCLINLISNAVKYTEKGSIEITAKVIDKNVELSVNDTGIGIKTEDIPKLFGPFVRLQSPLTLKTSGTGLGLYLIKKIAIDFLGGDVEVESELGKGSKFTLRVPVKREEKV